MSETLSGGMGTAAMGSNQPFAALVINVRFGRRSADGFS